MTKTIIILHGWGISGVRYQELKRLLEQKKYSVYTPDFPGFGQEPLVKDPMTLKDYAEFVVQFMKKKRIKKAYFIGHSFGGRVTAKLAVLHPELIEKIIFTGSPLVKQKLSLKKSLLQFLAKNGKILLSSSSEVTQKFAKKVIYRLIGEYDYYKANTLKETFKKIINEDGAGYIDKIKTPTLILWGEKDTFVNLKVAKQIAEKIPNAKLVVIKDAGHGIPYTHTKEFAQQTLSFLK